MIPKLLWITLLAVVTAGFGGGPAGSYHADDKNAVALKAAKIVKKDAVKLYPNPSTDGRITISSNRTETLHFYVFDLDGTLLHQVILKDKQKKTIENLKKGIYVYDAFLNDEGIEHGNIIVK
ncbi:MAG: T9SS type A sorting domain-containing protein [Chitinophagaceae bacterium]